MPGNRASWLKRVRQLHLYLGVFFAPSIVFFAFSGAFQLFGLHEARPGETYEPPAWIAKMASVHKDQTMAVEKHGPKPEDGAQGKSQEPAEAKKPPQHDGDHHDESESGSKLTLALKCFFLATAVGLISTTLLGIYMAFQYNRSRAVVWSLLIAGAAIPIALVAMMA